MRLVSAVNSTEADRELLRKGEGVYVCARVKETKKSALMQAIGFGLCAKCGAEIWWQDSQSVDGKVKWCLDCFLELPEIRKMQQSKKTS